MKIRWGIFFGLLGLILIYLIVSYVHADRRMKKGLMPLPYHRVSFVML